MDQIIKSMKEKDQEETKKILEKQKDYKSRFVSKSSMTKESNFSFFPIDVAQSITFKGKRSDC